MRGKWAAMTWAAIVAMAVTGAVAFAQDDTTPPVIERVSSSPKVLWPPNHQMVLVTVTADVTDGTEQSFARGTFVMPADEEPTWRIISVTSNEPEDAQTGDGHTAPDWQILTDDTLFLRAERAGNGNGRIYTITIEAADADGNTATGTTTVTVPHDQRGNDQPALPDVRAFMGGRTASPRKR